MVDMSLFRTRSYALGALLIGIYFTGVTSMFVVIAMYMQNGLGYPALEAALIGLPSAVASSVMAAVAGRLVLRTGRRLVVAGIATAFTALVLSMGVIWGHLEFGLSPWWLLATLALSGVGQGMTVSPNQTLSLAEVPPARSGVAGGVLQTGQRVGTALGSAVIVGVFFGLQSTRGWDTAFLASFALIGVFMLLALAVGIVDAVLSGRARGAGPSAAAPAGRGSGDNGAP